MTARLARRCGRPSRVVFCRDMGQVRDVLLRARHHYCRLGHGLLLLAVLLGLAAGPAAAQVNLTVDPIMALGPATAPVTIVEFSDYQ